MFLFAGLGSSLGLRIDRDMRGMSPYTLQDRLQRGGNVGGIKTSAQGPAMVQGIRLDGHEAEAIEAPALRLGVIAFNPFLEEIHPLRHS